MEITDLSVENKSRIEKLEQFKHELEKKLYAAIAVATVLGFASIVGGVWISSLSRDLNDLTAKTAKLEKKLSEWEKKVANAIIQLDDKKDKIIKVIELQSDSSINKMRSKLNEISYQNQQELNNLLEDKKKEIEIIGTNEIMNKLSNGSFVLSVKALQIKNAKGNIAVAMSSGKDGDGFIRVNSEKGEVRYLLSLTGNRAQSNYYNNNGKNVLSLGVYSNDNIGFTRYLDPEGKMTLLELKSDSKGGLLDAYSTNGKKIVYIGPQRDTGNGLVNVMGPKGNIAVAISSDKGSDGFIRVNSEKSEVRYLLSLTGNRAQSNYYNNNGKAVLSLGVYSDANIGFARYRDSEGKMTLLELKSGSKGGILNAYSTNGKKIVYIGPERDTGNGLVNAMGLHGERTASHSPKSK